jgi:hypothetical protein
MTSAPPRPATAGSASISSANNDDADHVVNNVADLALRRNPRHAAQDLVPVLSEDMIAREFVDRHEHVIRFDVTSDRRCIWDDTR